MPLDYAGKTLRGRLFKPGEDLREANFSGAKALEQVKALAEAGKNPKDGATQKAAKTASTMLKGIFAGLPAAAALVEAWNKLWPAIASLFSLA